MLSVKPTDVSVAALGGPSFRRRAVGAALQYDALQSRYHSIPIYSTYFSKTSMRVKIVERHGGSLSEAGKWIGRKERPIT